MTEKLFYQDSHMKSFCATVVSCASSEKGYEVVLDRTAFFPEGGGQAGDSGSLKTAAEEAVRVLDTKEREGIVYHLTNCEIAPGTEVEGELDWEKRFSRMQQHTGEHIASGLIHSRFGYDNVGFHLNDELCTLDLNGPITKEELREIEIAANEAVFADLPVLSSFPSGEELEKLEYRSKIEIEGAVHIVEIPGVDVCACCAPHLNRTGEIGLIKFVQMQNYKGGVRITMLSGSRALRDYQAKEECVKSIMFSLSAKEELAAEAVERMKEENSSLKEKLIEAQRELLNYKAQQIPEGTERVCLFETELQGSGPRDLMNLVLERGARVCGVFVGNDSDGYRYVIGSRESDVRTLGRNMNEKFAGRGGGKPEMVQGSLTCGTPEELKVCFMGEEIQ